MGVFGGGGEFVAPFSLSGSSTNIVISTNDVAIGDSKKIIIQTGTAPGNQGAICFRNGSEGTIGHVWTQTAADGSGEWALPGAISGFMETNFSNSLASTKDLALGGFKLTGVADPVAAQDAVTLNYFNNNPGSGMARNFSNHLPSTVDVNFGGNKLTSVADPTLAQDAATKNYVDTLAPSGANVFLSNLQAPTAINQDLTYAPSSGTWDIASSNQSVATTTAFVRLASGNATSAGNGQSGRVIVESGTGTQFSGLIDIATGDSAGSVGDLFLRTGDKTTAGSGVGRIFIYTGNTISGGSPEINITTGTSSSPNSISTGRIILGTGGYSQITGSADTGSIDLTTGANSSTDPNASSGRIKLETGTADQVSGLIQFTTGTSNIGNSGAINFTTGAANNGVSGNFLFKAGFTVGVRGSVDFDVESIKHNRNVSIEVVWESGVTGSRPTAVTGSRYFDTTLGKPIWYNGAAWVDALGALV